MRVRSKKRIPLKNDLAALVLIGPAVALISLFVILPFVRTLVLGFYDIKIYGDNTFVGWKNYEIVLNNREFWRSIGVGFRYVALLMPAQFTLALLIAMLIKGRRWGSGMVKSTIYIPNLISGIITGTIFALIFNYDSGLLNKVIGLFGRSPVPFTVEIPMFTVVVPGIWLGLGYVTLVLLSALNEVPAVYYEAAKLDGAGPLTSFFRITLPYIKNVIIYLLVTQLAGNLQQYELSLTITGDLYNGATTTPNYYIYNLLTYGNRRPQAIVASLVMFVILGAATAVMFMMMRSEKSVEA